MTRGRGNPQTVAVCLTASSRLGTICDMGDSPIRPSGSSCAEPARPISTGTSCDQAGPSSRVEYRSGWSLRRDRFRLPLPVRPCLPATWTDERPDTSLDLPRGLRTWRGESTRSPPTRQHRSRPFHQRQDLRRRLEASQVLRLLLSTAPQQSAPRRVRLRGRVSCDRLTRSSPQVLAPDSQWASVLDLDLDLDPFSAPGS